MFKRKKGFTLIEMLVVIAIIAILVSIMIPVIGKSTTRAAAATNAANLRSVQGAITTLRIGNPDAFKKETQNEMNRKQLTNEASKVMSKLALSGKIDAVTALGLVQSFVNMVLDSTNEAVVYYANDEGYLEIGDLKIEAPASKGLSIEGYNIREGTNMCVTITNTDVIASYAGIPTGCFAIIAEDGKSSDMKEDQTHHYSDDNFDGKCDICDGAMKDHSSDQISGGLNDDINTGGHICYSKDNNHECDAPDCNLSVNCPNDTNNDCACDNCGTATHTFTPKTGCDADENVCGRCGHAKENGCKAH